jgi:hypothetical protein
MAQGEGPEFNPQYRKKVCFKKVFVWGTKNPEAVWHSQDCNFQLFFFFCATSVFNSKFIYFLGRCFIPWANPFACIILGIRSHVFFLSWPGPAQSSYLCFPQNWDDRHTTRPHFLLVKMRSR